jgi:hypothetical protein
LSLRAKGGSVYAIDAGIVAKLARAAGPQSTEPWFRAIEPVFRRMDAADQRLATLAVAVSAARRVARDVWTTKAVGPNRAPP